MVVAVILTPSRLKTTATERSGQEASLGRSEASCPEDGYLSQMGLGPTLTGPLMRLDTPSRVVACRGFQPSGV
jgi:hypothetical protein